MDGNTLEGKEYMNVRRISSQTKEEYGLSFSYNLNPLNIVLLSKKHGKDILRGEQRMIWTLVVLGSLSLSGYFLYTNLGDYLDDTTVIALYDPEV